MKVKPGALQPDTVPAVHPLFYVRGGPRGLVLQAKPRRRNRPLSVVELQWQQRFAFAAQMASSPYWADLGTAIEDARGTEQVPRDFLTAAALGRYYVLEGVDGQVWGHVVGPVGPDPFVP